MNGSNKSPDFSATAQRIAERIVGECEWRGAEAFIKCPGLRMHTTPSGPRDCKVICERVGDLRPGIYCFHSSCDAVLRTMNRSLRSALGKAAPSQRHAFAAPAPRPAPPAVYDAEALRRFAVPCAGFDEACFAARSAIAPDLCTPVSFLHALYQPGENVLIFTTFKSQGQHVWKHHGTPYDARGLDGFRTGHADGVWFLINPTDAVMKRNANGIRSRRSQDNITAWRYWLLESDKAPADQWLAALSRLPQRIAAIYSSGGRSIHALIRADAVSKTNLDEEIQKHKSLFVTIGADPAAMSAVRLSRLPQCERGNKVQRLIYLNPAPTPTPICEMPEITMSLTESEVTK